VELGLGGLWLVLGHNMVSNANQYSATYDYFRNSNIANKCRFIDWNMDRSNTGLRREFKKNKRSKKEKTKRMGKQQGWKSF